MFLTQIISLLALIKTTQNTPTSDTQVAPQKPENEEPEDQEGKEDKEQKEEQEGKEGKEDKEGKENKDGKAPGVEKQPVGVNVPTTSNVKQLVEELLELDKANRRFLIDAMKKGLSVMRSKSINFTVEQFELLIEYLDTKVPGFKQAFAKISAEEIYENVFKDEKGASGEDMQKPGQEQEPGMGQKPTDKQEPGEEQDKDKEKEKDKEKDGDKAGKDGENVQANPTKDVPAEDVMEKSGNLKSQEPKPENEETLVDDKQDQNNGETPGGTEQENGNTGSDLIDDEEAEM